MVNSFTIRSSNKCRITHTCMYIDHVSVSCLSILLIWYLSLPFFCFCFLFVFHATPDSLGLDNWGHMAQMLALGFDC